MEIGTCLIKISTFLFDMDKETLFWFFSTIAQAYGTLIVITETCLIKILKFLFEIFKSFYTDEDTLFWFFSTIAQVYGTLLAIMGVFTVYVLEWLQRSIDWSRKDMVQQIKLIKPECKFEYIYLSLDEQLDYVKKTLQDTYPRGNNFDELIRITEVIYDRRVQREIFSNDFWRLMVLAMIVVFFSIISLCLVKNLIVINLLIFLLIPIGLCIILSFIILPFWVKDLLDRNTLENKREQGEKTILKVLRCSIGKKEKSRNEERKEEFDKEVKKFREKIKQQEKNKINI